ncbi:MAG TPA: hypothetical protein VN648_31640, partial [Candidatus Methylomirabilis sp.]|nr:hypothetical protein [Candidatus Methylomirabilis sp.]
GLQPELTLARKVKIRRFVDYDPARGRPESPAYLVYKEQMTYRWSVICQGCYSTIDGTVLGYAEIGGERYSLAGASRGDKATMINEEQYRKFLRKEAAKLGLDLGEESY